MNVVKTGTVFVNADSTPPLTTPSGEAVPTIQTRRPPKTAETEYKKLENLTSETEFVLHEVSAAFPFQLFPDKIVIDKSKITIVRNGLFYKRIIPIPIQDTLTVKMTRGILFAAIDFEIKGYETNPSSVTHLWGGEAFTALIYMLGLIQAFKNGIDLSKIPNEKILEKLEEIGRLENEKTNS